MDKNNEEKSSDLSNDERSELEYLRTNQEHILQQLAVLQAQIKMLTDQHTNILNILRDLEKDSAEFELILLGNLSASHRTTDDANQE